jgi:hypothetical protein
MSKRLVIAGTGVLLLSPALGGVASAHTTQAVVPTGAAVADPPPLSEDDLEKALACGLSAGLSKLKDGPAEAQDLYKAIKVTLIGRNLAKNQRLLARAAIQFGLDIVPLGACFAPIFFPDEAGGGSAPAAPTNLTVGPDPNNTTVMLLSWTDNSTNERGFQVHNGDEYRTAPGSPGTGTVTFSWTGLQPNSWTCFRVRADNGDTFSPWEPAADPHYMCAYTSPGTGVG